MQSQASLADAFFNAVQSKRKGSGWLAGTPMI
jgi:hypothetical protein